MPWIRLPLSIAGFWLLLCLILTWKLGGGILDTRPWFPAIYFLAYGHTGGGLWNLFVALVGTALLWFLVRWIITAEPASKGARFARASELSKMKLRGFGGYTIVYGRLQGTLIKTKKWLHTLIMAPTGSGKTWGYSITNALWWKGSLIVNDGKEHETELETAEWRRRRFGQKAHVLDMFNEHGSPDAINPFAVVRKHDWKLRIYDLQRIAHQFIPDPVRKETAKEIWQPGGRAALMGIALHMIEDGQPLCGENMWVNAMNGDLQRWCKDAAKAIANPKSRTKILLSDFAGRGDREAAGVRAELTSALEIFVNPLVCEATNRSTFSFDTFWREPTTLYINVEPPDGLLAQRLLALIYQQAFESFMRAGKLRRRKVKLPAHIVVDELSKLHYMPTLVDSLTNIRDYGVALSLIVQGDSQLDWRYGSDGAKIIRQNCANQLIMAPNDFEMCERISKRLGMVERKRPTSHKNYSNRGITRSYGHSIEKVPLMTPEDVDMLDEKKAIMFVQARRAVLFDKIHAATDRLFRKRILQPRKAA